jgi:hypothetical protein
MAFAIPLGRAVLRADERTLVATAGAVFALASAGAAMTAAAADAMFLAELGPGNLGQAVAVSSALLAVVLAVVGGLADRLERRRVLASLSLVSAGVVATLAGLAVVAPRAAALLALVGGKQLAAATDLAFWVTIAERVDARRSRRMLPMLAATGGLGATVGALLVIPLAPAFGPRGVLLAAAVLLALAGLGAAQLPATRHVALPGSRVGWLIVRSWRDGARAVRRHPLALHLAIVVAAAGVFGSLAYFALGVGVASRGGTASDYASLLGGVRAGGQIATLAVQIFIASGLLARAGTGRALLLAPLVALASGLGLVIAPILAIAIATQVSARMLDSSIETPAEKLAQTLLPSLVRGRVAGFLDGTAKRAGAVAGGLLAAALAGMPTAFYASCAIAAALWLLAASRIARELPALAIAHVAGDGAQDLEVMDDRVIGALVRELDGPRPERAAEVLARLHERGRVDAVPALARAATTTGLPAIWRALLSTLDQPREVCGPQLFEAAQAATARTRELAVRALGLAGGVGVESIDQWRGSSDIHLALTAEVAHLRLAGDHAGVTDALADGLRTPAARAAIEELVVELARANEDERVLESARKLATAIRRGKGDTASHASAFSALARFVAKKREVRSRAGDASAGPAKRTEHEAELSLLRADLLDLARERVERGASKPAPDTALVSLMRTAPGAADEAPEIAAALRLYGALLEGADSVEPEDLRRIARALGEPDDDVRTAAEEALVALGPTAAGELIATIAWGRRRARDRAAALLAELPVTPVTIDRLVDAELDALEQTAVAIAVLGASGDEAGASGSRAPGNDLVVRRLEERLREIAHTVLLLVAARRRSRAIASAATAWRHARGGLERARTLAVIETALPTALRGRLVEAVDDLTPLDRATGLERAGVALPGRDQVARAELAGRDRLARALVLHALGAAGRSKHRDTIAAAAHAEVLAASPAELLRRLAEAVDDDTEEGTDMPSRVETLIALGRVPLLAALTTRQLADVAERARWVTGREGSVVVTGGDPIDALIVVEDGELQLGDRRVAKGDVVDELACVAPAPASADLVVVRAARMIRLERVDFEELVDDVPGLASAVCRALGERARKAEDASYKSPLASRSG